MIKEKERVFCTVLGEGQAEVAEQDRPEVRIEPPPALEGGDTRDTAPAPAREHRLSAWQRFWRRRHYLVHPYLQLRLLANTMVCLTLFAIILIVPVLQPLVGRMQDYRSMQSESLTWADFLLYLHDRIWLYCALGMVLVILLSIRSSHKVAGALYRFRQVFREMAAGRIPHAIHIRRGDYLHLEEQEFNRALTGIWTGICELEELRQGLNNLAAATRGETRRRLLGEVDRLDGVLACMRREGVRDQ